MEELATLAIVVKAREEAAQALDRVRGSGEKLGGTFGSLGKMAAVAGGVVLGAATAMAGAVADFAVKSIDKTMEAGQAAFEMSEKFGIAKEQASLWIGVGDQLGISSGQVSNGFRFLSRQIERTQQALDAGGKKAAAIASGPLGQLGISILDATGKQKSMNEIMLEAADRFATMPDGAQKAALAMQLFGRAGQQMIPMLNEGREGIKKYMDQAQAEGDVLSGPNVDAAHKAYLAHQQFDAALKGVSLTLGVLLLPAFTFLINSITNYVIPAFRTLANWLGPILQPIFAALSTDVLNVGTFLQHNLVPAVQPLIEVFLHGVVPALQAVGNVITAVVIPTFMAWWQFFQASVLPVLATAATFIFGTLVPALIHLASTIVQQVMPYILGFATAIWQYLISPLVTVATVVIPPLISVLQFLADHLSVIIPFAIAFGAVWAVMRIAPVVSSIITFVGTLDQLLPRLAMATGSLLSTGEAATVAAGGLSLMQTLGVVVLIAGLVLLLTHLSDVGNAIQQMVDPIGAARDAFNKMVDADYSKALDKLTQSTDTFKSSLHDVTGIINGQFQQTLDNLNWQIWKNDSAWQAAASHVDAFKKSAGGVATLGAMDGIEKTNDGLKRQRDWIQSAIDGWNNYDSDAKGVFNYIIQNFGKAAPQAVATFANAMKIHGGDVKGSLLDIGSGFGGLSTDAQLAFGEMGKAADTAFQKEIRAASPVLGLFDQLRSAYLEQAKQLGLSGVAANNWATIQAEKVAPNTKSAVDLVSNLATQLGISWDAAEQLVAQSPDFAASQLQNAGALNAAANAAQLAHDRISALADRISNMPKVPTGYSAGGHTYAEGGKRMPGQSGFGYFEGAETEWIIPQHKARGYEALLDSLLSGGGGGGMPHGAGGSVVVAGGGGGVTVPVVIELDGRVIARHVLQTVGHGQRMQGQTSGAQARI